MTLTWQDYNFGSQTNIGDADNINTAFMKTNNNLLFLKERITYTFIDAASVGEQLLITTDTFNYKFKSLISPNNNTTIITSEDGNSILIETKDSINSLSEDIDPILSSNLNVNGFEIFNKIDDEYSNLKLNELFVSTVNNSVELYSDKSIAIKSDTNIILLSNIDADGMEITCDSLTANTITVGDLTSSSIITGNFVGTLVGDVIGNTDGIHTGSVVGNVSGQVSDISNHVLNELMDISIEEPVIDQILVWNGSEYVPTTLNELTAKAPVRLPLMTEDERDLLSPLTGDMIFNTTISMFQGYRDGVWVDLG